MKEIIRRLNQIDVFSPYFFFPFIMALYFFVSLFDFGKAEYFELKRSIFFPVIVGLLSYFAAVYVAQKRDWTFPTFGLRFLKGKTIYFLYLLGLIGLVSYFIMVFKGQIGIADESVRRHLDPKLNFLSSFFWFSALFLLAWRIMNERELTAKKKRIYAGILLTIFVMYILMGYRTPIVIMLFTALIVIHYVVKRVKFTWFITFIFLVGVSLSLFGFFRVLTEDTSKEFNSRQGPDVELSEEELSRDQQLIRKINETPKWVRALTEVSVTGRIVLSKLIEYTDKHGYLHGQLHAGIFSTLLPGEQLSPRMQVTEMVNELSVKEGKYITRPGRTTTPTFIGQLYVEYGYITVILGCALYGFILSLLYNQMKRTGMRSYQTIAYAFITTLFVISIHTGLLDLVFLLMIGYALVSTSIEQTKEKVSV
jgi:hypothetical protein